MRPAELRDLRVAARWCSLKQVMDVPEGTTDFKTVEVKGKRYIAFTIGERNEDS